LVNTGLQVIRQMSTVNPNVRLMMDIVGGISGLAAVVGQFGAIDYLSKLAMRIPDAALKRRPTSRRGQRSHPPFRRAELFLRRRAHMSHVLSPRSFTPHSCGAKLAEPLKEIVTLLMMSRPTDFSRL
jgi:hypothetical protein